MLACEVYDEKQSFFNRIRIVQDEMLSFTQYNSAGRAHWHTTQTYLSGNSDIMCF